MADEQPLILWLLATIRTALGVTVGGGGDVPRPKSHDDWRMVIELAARTRTSSLLGWCFAQSDLEAPMWARAVLVTSYRESLRRSAVYLEELDRIAATVEDRQLGPVVVRKGAYLCRLFPDIGVRPFDDIDLLIAPDRLPGMLEALSRLGYIAGRLSADRRRIVPFGRADRVRYMVGTNALPALVRLHEVRYGLPYSYSLDIVRSLRPPQMGGGPDTATLLRDAKPLIGKAVYSLSGPHLLLDACVNLFITSTTLHYVWRQRYRRLIPYLDLLVLMTNFPHAIGDFARVYGDHEASRLAAAFALGNLERLFPGALPPQTTEGETLWNHGDSSLLDSIGTLELDRSYVWTASLVDRVFRDVALPEGLPPPPDLGLPPPLELYV
jgi:hypothetical protein